MSAQDRSSRVRKRVDYSKLDNEGLSDQEEDQPKKKSPKKGKAAGAKGKPAERGYGPGADEEDDDPSASDPAEFDDDSDFGSKSKSKSKKKKAGNAGAGRRGPKTGAVPAREAALPVTEHAQAAPAAQESFAQQENTPAANGGNAATEKADDAKADEPAPAPAPAAADATASATENGGAETFNGKAEGAKSDA